MTLAESDRALLMLMRTRGHDSRLETAAAVLSRVGEHAACWLALGAAGSLLAGRPAERREWRRGVCIVATSYAINYAVKVAVRRARPELPALPQLVPTVTQLSFPSAHATTSFAAASAYRQVAPAWLLYAAALMLAVGRPYLGVHYPSDVLAGAILGTLVAGVWPR